MVNNLRIFHSLIEEAAKALKIIEEDSDMVKLARSDNITEFRTLLYPRLIQIISDNIMEKPLMYRMFIFSYNVRSSIMEQCSNQFVSKYKR